MVMSDCRKCWETPCCCGFEYKWYTTERLSNHIASITQYRSKEEAKAIIEGALKIVDEIDNWYGNK